MYKNARCCVRVNGTLSEGFIVKVGAIKDQYSSPLLFILVVGIAVQIQVMMFTIIIISC